MVSAHRRGHPRLDEPPEGRRGLIAVPTAVHEGLKVFGRVEIEDQGFEAKDFAGDIFFRGPLDVIRETPGAEPELQNVRWRRQDGVGAVIARGGTEDHGWGLDRLGQKPFDIAAGQTGQVAGDDDLPGESVFEGPPGRGVDGFGFTPAGFFHEGLNAQSPDAFENFIGIGHHKNGCAGQKWVQRVQDVIEQGKRQFMTVLRRKNFSQPLFGAKRIFDRHDDANLVGLPPIQPFREFERRPRQVRISGRALHDGVGNEDLNPFRFDGRFQASIKPVNDDPIDEALIESGHPERVRRKALCDKHPVGRTFERFPADDGTDRDSGRAALRNRFPHSLESQDGPDARDGVAGADDD